MYNVINASSKRVTSYNNSNLKIIHFSFQKSYEQIGKQFSFSLVLNNYLKIIVAIKKDIKMYLTLVKLYNRYISGIDTKLRRMLLFAD